MTSARESGVTTTRSSYQPREKGSNTRRKRVSDGFEPSEKAFAVYELEAHRLAPYAQKLAQFRRGSDPVELYEAWDAVAFQVQGLSKKLSASQAYMILRAFSTGKVLQQHEGAWHTLLAIMIREGPGGMKVRKITRAWVALDRADIFLNEEQADFFRIELSRLLPKKPDESLFPQPRTEAKDKYVTRGADRVWRRVHAMLEASGCTAEELLPLWKVAEAAMLADGRAIRTLELDGLISALRAAALVRTRINEKPSDELVRQLLQRATAQSPWLDGWGVSHVALAAARLGAAPGDAYDSLRGTLLDRCLLPPTTGVTSNETQGLREAKRVASALAHFDVHDAEVRNKAASWLFRPLPIQYFVAFAMDLASAGANDVTNPKLARHIRARARTSEAIGTVGAQTASALLKAYAQME